MMENFENQGRRKDQMESNYKVMFAGCAGFLLVVVATIIFGIVTNG